MRYIDITEYYELVAIKYLHTTNEENEAQEAE